MVAVGIGNKTYSVQIIVDWLNEGQENSCYILKNGKKVKVEARLRENGKWYLTTGHDNGEVNYLDLLDPCR